jgi:hypothetical protein
MNEMTDDNLSKDVVTISRKEYDSLVEDAFLLECLRNAGVDNWEGWDYALQEFHNEADWR